MGIKPWRSPFGTLTGKRNPVNGNNFSRKVRLVDKLLITFPLQNPAPCSKTLGVGCQQAKLDKCETNNYKFLCSVGPKGPRLLLLVSQPLCWAEHFLFSWRLTCRRGRLIKRRWRAGSTLLPGAAKAGAWVRRLEREPGRVTPVK